MSENQPRLLIIDDDPDVLLAAKLLLKRRYPHIQTENDPYRLNAILKNDHYDLVLLDMNFRAGSSNGNEGIRWMKKILRQSPTTHVILMTAYGEIELAVRAMKEGASDFVVKPWQNDHLLESIATALEEKKDAETLAISGKTSVSQPGFGSIVGQSQAMKDVFATIEKVGKTDVNVLVLGENGTGKELIARALHQSSPRKDKVFVNVDLGAIPESLFESELFGHTKGSFTDAREDRAGRFEHADGGTLFLDEIGNLSMPLQAKLLTALQSREITRVGSNKSQKTDIRLICATNMPLYQMVADSSFRQDLLYRINTVEITLPSLRERSEDVVHLANYYLDIYASKYNKGDMEILPETLKKLQQYAWPGNIRELQHSLERAVILSDFPALRPDDFNLQGASIPTSGAAPAQEQDNLNLEEVEKSAIRDAILKHNGNLSRAAKELGLGRTTLYRKLSKYGL